MKYIIYILLLFPAILTGQLAPNDQGIFEFQRIAEFDSLTEKQIHERTLNWFAETFTSAEDVIHSTTDSKIAGTYVAHYKTQTSFDLSSQRITIDIKKGAARFTVNQIVGMGLFDRFDLRSPLEIMQSQPDERPKVKERRVVLFETIGSEIAKVYDGYVLYMTTKEDW